MIKHGYLRLRPAEQQPQWAEAPKTELSLMLRVRQVGQARVQGLCRQLSLHNNCADDSFYFESASLTCVQV